MRSIRKTTTILTGAGMIVLLLAAGTTIFLAVKHSLVHQFDQSLLHESQVLWDTVEQDDEKLEIEYGDLNMKGFHRPDGPAYLQMIGNNGRSLYGSPSLDGRTLNQGILPSGNEVIYRWGRLGEQNIRVIEIAFHPRLEHDKGDDSDKSKTAELILILARDAGPLLNTIAVTRSILIVVGIATLVFTLVVLWFTVRWGLGGLNTVANQIGRIDPDNLSCRLKPAPPLKELTPILSTLNKLLDRLDITIQREKEFTSDVAHELRTPLAGLRSATEVAVSRDRPVEEYKETLHDCLQSAIRMQAMVEGLLTLSKLDTGRIHLNVTEVIPDHLLQKLWESFQDTAARKNVRLQWDLTATMPFRTDVSLLSVIVSNILDNAVSYVNKEGQITIEAMRDTQTGNLHIRITNTGCNLNEDQVKMVFERFWRENTARSNEDGHFGLGLSIVRRAVAALDGQINATSQDDWFTIFLSLSDRIDTICRREI